MSKLRHNNVRVYEIILMVIVAQFLQRPSIANAIEYYGKPLTPSPYKDRPVDWQLRNRLSKNPQLLFNELEKFPAKNLATVENPKREEYINFDMKLMNKYNSNNNWSNYPLPLDPKPQSSNVGSVMPQASNISFEILQQEPVYENVQSADQELERMMKLKHKLQAESEQMAAEAKQRSQFDKVPSKKCLTHTVFYKKSNVRGNMKPKPRTGQHSLAGKPKAEAKAQFKPTSSPHSKSKPNEIAMPSEMPMPTTCTSTTCTSTTSTSTTCTSTTCSTTTKCPRTEPPTGDPITLEHLQSIKKRAFIIINSCNKLEKILIQNCARLNTGESVDWLKNKVYQITKNFERLEKPPVLNISHANHRGFYFGLTPPGEIDTDEIIAGARKEQQKLEEKVREEYQMERNARRLARKNCRKIQNKIKRARYEAAPPGAARLEQMGTTPTSNRVSDTKENQNYPPQAQLKEIRMNELKNKIKVCIRRNIVRLAFEKLPKRGNLAKIIRNSKSSKRALARLKESLSNYKGDNAMKFVAASPIVREKKRRRQIRRLRQRLASNKKH